MLLITVTRVKGKENITSWKNGSHSWKNPNEHLKSILNLDLQVAGSIRKPILDKYENLLSKCDSMKESTWLPRKKPQLRE